MSTDNNTAGPITVGLHSNHDDDSARHIDSHGIQMTGVPAVGHRITFRLPTGAETYTVTAVEWIYDTNQGTFGPDIWLSRT